MADGLDYRYRSERMGKRKPITERELFDLEHSRPGRSYLAKKDGKDGSECLSIVPLVAAMDKPTDKPVRMHSKEYQDKRNNRREATGKLFAAAKAKGLDVRAIVGADVYGMLVKMFDEHMNATQIAEIYGCSRQTVCLWVHGAKNSAYTKLRYWVSRK